MKTALAAALALTAVAFPAAAATAGALFTQADARFRMDFTVARSLVNPDLNRHFIQRNDGDVWFVVQNFKSTCQREARESVLYDITGHDQSRLNNDQLARVDIGTISEDLILEAAQRFYSCVLVKFNDEKSGIADRRMYRFPKVMMTEARTGRALEPNVLKWQSWLRTRAALAR